MGEDFRIHSFNFKKNMTGAVGKCSEHFENATLPYYQCLCSGLAGDSFTYTRYKYYFCKRAADLEKEASAKDMKEVGETVGIVLGVCVLLFLLIFIYRKFKVQIKRCLGSAFTSIGIQQHCDACCRVLCFCCQKHPSSQLDELPPDENLSDRKANCCSRFCYSDAFLGFMEFICDCDCFRTRRAPKYLIPILGKPKPRAASPGDGGEGGSMLELQENVELQQPRRMRSVRKAPPPPVPASGAAASPTASGLPDTPGYDPARKEGFGTGKRRAPPPPGAKPYSVPPPQYDQLHFQPGPAAAPQPRRPPLQVPNEFTAQLNQAMAGRRWPSESEI